MDGGDVPTNVAVYIGHMNILVKIASRERPGKLLEVVEAYRNAAAGPVRILVSLDHDDHVMQEHANELRHPQVEVRWGTRSTKIGAINRDVKAFEWDVVVVGADDMVPVADYDRIIARRLGGDASRPVAIWCPDGRQNRICTVPAMTRAYFNLDGYLFHPEYKSYYPDDEWTEKAIARNMLLRIDEPMFRHDHPFFVRAGNDRLYDFNRQFKREDRETYIRRKLAGYP